MAYNFLKSYNIYFTKYKKKISMIVKFVFKYAENRMFDKSMKYELIFVILSRYYLL